MFQLALLSVIPSWAVNSCLLVIWIVCSEWLYDIFCSVSNIPTFNSAQWLGSYFSRLKFFVRSRHEIFEGYKKYKSTVYKVPRWSTGWAIIVTGDKLVDELHRLPDDVHSLEEAARDEIQTPHTMGQQTYLNPYHLTVLKANLTLHTDHLVNEIMDEAIIAFDELIGSSGTDDWREFEVNEHISRIISRTFNRVVVGAPLCRDSTFNELACQFSISVYVTSNLINLFPSIFRNFIGRIFGRATAFQKKASRYLGPLIEERRRMLSTAFWPDKPNDVLSWLMDHCKGNEFDSADIQSRILTVNAATSHTSSYTFMQALLNMASRPEVIHACTIESEEAVRRHGWTRDCINSLALLDSFFKESMRMNGLAARCRLQVSFPRKMIQPYTMSNGTYLPVGAFVSASFAAHFDEEYYPNPHKFEAFRFVDGCHSRVNNSMATTSSRFLPFGHGAHACPGRFLVSYALKALMAHILLNYELKMGGDGVRKPDFWFSYHCTPNASATVSIRRKNIA